MRTDRNARALSICQRSYDNMAPTVPEDEITVYNEDEDTEGGDYE